MYSILGFSLKKKQQQKLERSTRKRSWGVADASRRVNLTDVLRYIGFKMANPTGLRNHFLYSTFSF